MTPPGCLGDWYTGLGTQTLAPKKHYQDFFVQLYFNKKYVEVAINYFTVHVIISKWFTRQKIQTEEKTIETKGVEVKEEIISENIFFNLDM